MVINWNRNPLETVIEIDDADRIRMRDALYAEELEERMYSAKYQLEKGDLKAAALLLDPESINVDKWLGHRIKALSEPHMGDCICQPCSCTKCHAEYLLGICTIGRMTNHMGSAMAYAFRTDDPMRLLESEEFVGSYSDELKKRWLRDRKLTRDWLKEYWKEYGLS